MRDADYQTALDTLAAQGRLRCLPESAEAAVNLLSNDYLAIAQDEELYANFVRDVWLPAAGAAGKSFSPSGSASRLLGGNAASAAACETAAARAWGIPALYLNSGYHANIGILPALTTKRSLILADKDIHASLIDGIRLSDAKLLRWPHQDLDALAKLLAKHRSSYDSIWLVTESVFSMDGSLTDLPRLAALAQQYDARFYLDEAHAVGIYGGGLGLAAEMHIAADILVLPLAKAMASYGALVLARDPLRSTIINRCRSLIFASALPPIITDWTRFVIEQLDSFADRRQRLFAASRQLQQAAGTAAVQNTPIIPIVLGDEKRTMEAAKTLAERGIAVGAVRHPTVALGKAQLRLCASAALSAANLDTVGQALQAVL